jgi:threonine/homoserine/homoserine lactone efflux protein
MTDLPTFLLALTIAYVVPGPDFALVVSSATRGPGLGRAAAGGVLTGLTTHALLAAAGVSSLLAATPWGLTALRVAGGAVLVWMGLTLLAGALRGGLAPAAVDAAPLTARAAWRRGFVGNLLNPKTLLFFVALIPQFVDRGDALLPQVAALSALTVAAGAVWWSLVVGVADRLGPVLARPRVRRRVDAGTGVALVGLAGIVAVL